MRSPVILCIVLWFSIAVSAQVTLPNGHVVPRDSFFVFLFIGHSNMAGRDKSALDTLKNPFMWNFQLDRTPLDVWVPARDPIHVENPPFAEFGCGPGMPFLEALSAACPGYCLGIVQNANSHYCIGGDYRRGKDAYIEEMGAAQPMIGKVRFGGIVAMLGWVEAEDQITAANPFVFAAQESCMVDEMRTDLEEPALPFVIGEFENGATSTLAVERDTVAAQILTTTRRISHSAIVSSDGMTYIDDHHYDCASQRVWAARMAKIFMDSGWVPGAPLGARGVGRGLSGPDRSIRKDDRIEVFDPRGRLVVSLAVTDDGRMPRPPQVRGVFFVKHTRGGTVLSTATRCFF